MTDEDPEKLAKLRDQLLTAEERDIQRRWFDEDVRPLSRDVVATGGPDKDRGVV